MKGAKRAPRTSLAGNPPLSYRVEAVAMLLPSTGEQVASSWLVRRLNEKSRIPRRTALRWLRESTRYIPPGHHYPFVTTVKSGRSVLYGLNLTGLMNPEQARWFLRGATIGFLDQAPKLADEYADSAESMRLFWEQASSALVLSMIQLLASAQSVTFAQVHARARPSVEVARAQADVLTETFVRPWIQDLVAALHRFLEVEGERNRRTPRLANGRLAAPSAMQGFNLGWKWANGSKGAAHRVWVARMKGPEAGPWGNFLERVQREDQERMLRLHAEAVATSDSSSS